jgi:hypothetical protein
LTRPDRPAQLVVLLRLETWWQTSIDAEAKDEDDAPATKKVATMLKRRDSNAHAKVDLRV